MPRNQEAVPVHQEAQFNFDPGTIPGHGTIVDTGLGDQPELHDIDHLPAPDIQPQQAAPEIQPQHAAQVDLGLDDQPEMHDIPHRQEEQAAQHEAVREQVVQDLGEKVGDAIDSVLGPKKND